MVLPSEMRLSKFLTLHNYCHNTVPAIEDSLAVPKQTTVETAAQEMWEAIKRLQQEWSRFVTIVKQQHKLDEVSYHKLFDILKQYQKEVNELRAERMAKNANPLALVATAQTLQDPYYQSSKSHKSYAPTSKASLPTRSHATTRHKGKEIAKPITPPSESASEEDKNLQTYQQQPQNFLKHQKNVDTTPRYKNDNQSGQFGNQRAENVAGARETECRKPKWVKDFTYHQVQYDTDDNVFANDIQHFEQSESISNTCAVETGDSNVIPDSPDMCDNDIQDDQNDVECDDERVALANLIANLKLDVDENKKIQKQLKKANATLTQELTECKSILAETSRTLGESNSIQDSCLVALQNKQTEFERYKAFNDRTVDYDKLERKLNETLGLLAQKEIDIKEGLKVKAYEISVVKEKHDELVKQSLLTKSHYEGLVKEKTKVITDLKLKEEKDIDKMISMENQLKFLNEIVYKRSQSIQTIHMLAPKCPTFNGRPTFANPMYLKKAQYEKPCLYAIPHDQSDPANRLVPDREETLTLEEESRSKLNKDLVKPFDYTKLNSLYEIFKPPTQHYEIQFAQANEIRKKMWRKSFVKTKPNIFKNIDFLPVSKSISKSRQAYNVMTNNINHLKEIVDQAWVKHSNDRLHLRNPTAQDMEILVKTCLMPLALKTQNDSFAFVHELKQEMHADLKYVESLEDEIDELESDKAEFSNMYDMLLQECVSNDIMCSYLQSSSDLDEITELQCLYLHKVRECDCLAQKLSEQTEFVSKEIYTELLRSFAKLEKHSISLEIALQQCQEQLKNDTVCKEKASNVFRKEREQYFEIQDLKAQLAREEHCNKFVQLHPIIVDSDLVQGNITIKRVYYVEGLNHNLFLIGQFCDADLEVAFQKSTCFVRDLQGNNLLTGNCGTDLYTISLQETISSTPICLMAKASPTQAWLWHRRLSHLNFDYINLLLKKDVVIGLPKLKYVKDQLCSSCEVSKARRSSFKSKTVPSLKGRLNLLHMDLCGPMRVASINGKKYILVIVDDYSRYTWTLFLRSKDETPEVLKDFLMMIQRNLQAASNFVRHLTEQNRTLVEAARTMLLASKLPLFFWAEAIATACYTQNRSIIIPNHEKTFTRVCENLDKMKEKEDLCILWAYSTQSKGIACYNSKNKVDVESIYLRFDEDQRDVRELSVLMNHFMASFPIRQRRRL
ncbi:retrovirus-related pol polyprotein from transposon TNT 1-94 [Tanacetum coccineum]